MSWKVGPLPKNTYGWGGVVPVEQAISGFYFADFRGDHVICYPGERVLKAHEIKWYDNPITELPPRDD